MNERRLARVSVWVTAALGALWGLFLAVRSLFFDDLTGPVWLRLTVSGITLGLGLYAGFRAGKWVVKWLVRLRNNRVLRILVSPFLGAVAGSTALIVIWEVSYVLGFYTGVIEFGTTDVWTVVIDVLPVAAVAGALVGAATALVLAVAFSAFPPPRRVRME